MYEFIDSNLIRLLHTGDITRHCISTNNVHHIAISLKLLEDEVITVGH